MSYISAEKLRSIVHYDATTGIFTRLDGGPPSRTRTDGRYAGYVRLTIHGYNYQAARLAWLYAYGEMPRGEVDHINQVRGDNRIANLRVATRQQNARNLKLSKKNTTGATGVIRTKDGLWQAQLWVKRPPLSPGKRGGTTMRFGVYPSFREAVAARRTAEKIIFGEFAPRH